MAQAQKAKELGNAAFKDGNYTSAVGHYASAILADQTNPTYPLNRAAAYLKLGKHNDAERDCSTVLSLDESNVKALFRRAQARIALDNLVGAQTDLRRALELEPTNQSVKLELTKIDISLQKRSKKPTQSPANVAPADTKPKRRRIPIKIVDTPKPAKNPVSEPQNQSSPANVANLLTPVSSRPLQNQNVQSSSSPSAEPITSPPSISTSQEARAVKIGGGIFRSSGSHTIFNSPSPQPASTEINAPPQVAQPRQTGNQPAAGSTSQDFPPLTKPATSLFIFTRTWESLVTLDEKWGFLQQNIAPQSLPTLFQTSLDPTLFTSLLATFHSVLKSSPDVSSLVKQYMINLSRVARFGTILLFTNKEAKAVVGEIWTILSANSTDEEAIDAESRRVWGVIS